MLRPRIKRTTEQIETPEGDLILVRPSDDNDLRIEGPSDQQRRLIVALDGSRTVEALEQEFGEKEVDTAISGLGEMGVIEDAADDDFVPSADFDRYDRQLRYFSDVGSADLPPSESQRRLREAKVAVLGVGGLGSAAALWLASVGIGEMWLVDGDRVEPSN